MSDRTHSGHLFLTRQAVFGSSAPFLKSEPGLSYRTVSVVLKVSPGNTALDFSLLLGQLLQPQNALRLDLKESFVGRQPDVVHAFWIRDSQPGSLAPRQK